ncbi:MAG: formate--tetrahydrofolate ligase [Gammaproteobacteria bacterium]|nr:formate--tetrahydrofolate ligase [Gammaproteobacteria bacterium]
MKSDIEISNEYIKRRIEDVASELNIDKDDLELYGKYKAKLNESVLKSKDHKAKLVLVTAITPTKAGEGKTTVSIGLAEGLRKLNKNVCLALREPSLGPVMGLKGGATGGGYAQVVPMDEINLHFTGDLHAITAANNLISSVIDNEIYYGNKLNLDPERIVFTRCLDINDRSLREVRVGMGSRFNGVERPDKFKITVASEIMAVFCLANSLKDLENRLNGILIGYTYDDKEVYVKDLYITGALLVLLKEAFKPNIVQTVEGGPALIHGGPFANIAHGCNSVMATNYARHLSDYVVTEAGFGADLGCEKFLDIKARVSGNVPSVVVIVATIRALKMHGGVALEDLGVENVDKMLEGILNLERHINTVKTFNLPYIVAINHFFKDTENETKALEDYLEKHNHPYALAKEFEFGGDGMIDLANKVLEIVDNSKPDLKYLYEESDSIKDKIFKISSKAYGAKGVKYSDKALAKIEEYEKKGYNKLLICMAKTQNSVTDDAKLLNAPTDFLINVRDLSLSLGAGFIVVYTGKIITMPGLPEEPASKKMGIDENGEAFGIF